jgi:hypothetical protein
MKKFLTPPGSRSAEVIRQRREAMLPKFVIVCSAATAFVATTALMPTGASAGGRGGAGNVPQPGTWNLELAALC